MKTVTLDGFLRDLPKLTSGTNNVVIATYNNLYGYENGGVFTANGKTVTILCGGAAYANFFRNADASSIKTAEAKKVSDGLGGIESGSLVILYAGESRFCDMVLLAYALAKRGVKVALISCGCDCNVFSGLVTNEKITAVMPYGGCNGGRRDLARIAVALLS